MAGTKPVTARGVLIALALGLLAWALAAAGFPRAPELPEVPVWQRLDVPVALAGLALFLGLAFFARPPALLGRLPRWLPLLLAAAATLLGQALLPTTLSNDEQAYLLQAEHFAAGRLSEPLSAAPQALQRRQVFDDAERGVRFSKYPPGTAAALTPGAVLGWPQLMVIVAGLLDLLLTGAIARRLGLATARLAPLLLAACPLFFLLQTSFQSEVFTLPAALAGYYALLRARAEGARRLAWGAAVGACAGWIFITRPLTGVLFAAAMLPGLAWRPGSGAGAAAQRLAGAVAGGLPFLALVLLYNQALTGDALLAPYEAYARAVSPFDRYPFFLAPGSATPVAAAFRNLFLQFGRWVPGLFAIFGAFLLGFWGLWRLRSRDGAAGLVLALLLPLAYALHWYPGHWAYPGPIYCYESLGLMVVGALAVLDAAPERFRRALPWAALLAGAALIVARWPALAGHSALRDAPRLAAAAAAAPRDAVVLLPFSSDRAALEKSLKHYTPSRPPFSKQAQVFVREMPDPRMTREVLRALGLGGRPLFRFEPDAGGGPGRLRALAR